MGHIDTKHSWVSRFTSQKHRCRLVEILHRGRRRGRRCDVSHLVLPRTKNPRGACKMIFVGLILSFFFYALSHYADYLVQADAWGWTLPAWYDKTRRTSGFIPRDHWHWSQWMRNTLWTYLPVMIFIQIYPILPYPPAMRLVGAMCSIALMYATSRGIGFSLTRKILN